MDECLVNYKHSFVPDLLKDKVAFITGGGSGIGFTIAEILMRHGCDMAIASRSEGKLQEAAKKLEAATGRRCFYVAMDIRKPAEVMSAVDKILEQYGKIDILVNNAAGNFLAPLAAMSFNAFRTVLEIDTFGTFNASKAVFDKYFKNHGGVIVNISATLYYTGTALQAHAGPAKAAIDALTKHMSVEWGPLGIRVNSVAPGPIEGTEGMRKLGGPAFEKDQQRILRQIPMGRMGKKEEIGHMTLYLVSDLGSYVTGTVAVVDGGNWLANGNSMEEATNRMKAIFAQGKL